MVQNKLWEINVKKHSGKAKCQVQREAVELWKTLKHNKNDLSELEC